MIRRSFLIGFAVVTLGNCLLLGGQSSRPLSPLPSGGLRVAPFFDGWYPNADGTITFSFGYSNLNKETIEIPLGPNNFIEPKQYDGRQPTSFPPDAPGADEGGAGRADRPGRERGVFTVTVPASFQDSVVWTLQLGGQTYKVPGNAKSGAYQLRWPMAMGSIPPTLRFAENGPAGRGPTGIQADPVRATVGTPLALKIWISDESVREVEPVLVRPRQARPAMTATWYKHSGPGSVAFSPQRAPTTYLVDTSTTSATFTQPGDYVIRVRADNFGRLDTSPGNQCCWTNGYVKVTVTP